MIIHGSIGLLPRSNKGFYSSVLGRINNRRRCTFNFQLPTSGQPFGVSGLYPRLAKYRLECLDHQYNINASGSERDGPMMCAFRNHSPEIVSFGSEMTSFALNSRLRISLMPPICLQTSDYCIGVIECSMTTKDFYVSNFRQLITAFKEKGLDIPDGQELIPYKSIDNLKSTRGELGKILETICVTCAVKLGQVWICPAAHQSSSSFSKDPEKRSMIPVRLISHIAFMDTTCDMAGIPNYNKLCEICPLTTKGSIIESTLALADHETRICQVRDEANINQRVSLHPEFLEDAYHMAICLGCIQTGEVCYAFEFVWFRSSSDDWGMRFILDKPMTEIYDTQFLLI